MAEQLSVNAEELVRFADEAVFAKTKRHLKDIDMLILRGALQNQNYETVAQKNGFTAKYLRQDIGPKLWKLLSEVFGEKVSKTNFQSALERQWWTTRQVQQKGNFILQDPQKQSSAHLTLVPPIPFSASSQATKPTPKIIASQQDWGEATDASVFYGRTTELSTLAQWMMDDRCRLVTLFGMGGIGKTTLSVKLVEQIQSEFDYFIWRSLCHAPPLEDTLLTLLTFFSDYPENESNVPQGAHQGISHLLHHLNKYRCLIVLDNIDAILRSEDSAGRYKEGYEGYEELFRRVGEQRHQSCLLLTSREKSKEIGLLEGTVLPVRSLHLSGLSNHEGREILKMKGAFATVESDWDTLITHYAGNPLALKIVATAIEELFDGNISQFLELGYPKQGVWIFDDIQDLLEQHFDRLSDLEKEVMYWLAIEREPVSLLQLEEDITVMDKQRRLPKALISLKQRSLIEGNSTKFTQQPIVMEYVTNQFVEQVSKELITGEIKLFVSHFLVKAQAKDYLRERQICLILEPILEKICTFLGSKEAAKQKLDQILHKIRETSFISQGYGAGNIINLLRQLNIDLAGYDFSSLTIWQSNLQDINLHHVNFADADLTKSVFTETFGNTLSLAFSSDGNQLATGDSSGTVHLWQVANTEHLLRCNGHSSWVWSVAFSPDGQRLASGSIDQTVRIWDIRTGQCLNILDGHTSWVRSVSFSPDSQVLASGSDDRTVKLWDIHTGQCLKTLDGHTSSVQSIRFSPDSQVLASGSGDRTVKLWDVHTGQCLKMLDGHRDSVWSVDFSADGQIFASSSSDCTVKLWDIRTGQCLKTLDGHTSCVQSIRFSPEGHTLASGSGDRTVKLWDVHTGQCLKTLGGHGHSVWSVDFSAGGQILASSSGDDQLVKLWDVYTGLCLKILQGYSNCIRSVSFSPDGQTLASGSENQKVKLWSVQTGRCLHTLDDHSGQVWSVSFSPDGQVFASGSCDQTIKLWDVHTGQCFNTLYGHTGQVLSVHFSPQDQTLASCDHTGTIKIWDIRTGQCLRILQGHTNWIWSISFSPDGQVLASGSHDATVRLWNVQTGQCLNVLEEHVGRVWSVSFSPDSQTLASSSEDGTIKLWHSRTGQCFSTLPAHTNLVLSLSFSSDGQLLASGSQDGIIKLWDSRTGQCLKAFQGHSDEVWSVNFSSCGQILASGSQDQTIKIWDVKTGKCLKTWRDERPYEGMNISRVQGLSAAKQTTLKILGAIKASASGVLPPHRYSDWR